MGHRQHGAALIVTLVILFVALMLGISSIQSSLLAESFSGNYRIAVQAQMAAEESASEALLEFLENPSSIEFYPVSPEVVISEENSFEAYSPRERRRGNIRKRYIFIRLLPENAHSRMPGKYLVAMGSVISGDEVVARSEPVFVRLTSMAAMSLLGGAEPAVISRLAQGNYIGGGDYSIPSLVMTNAHHELVTVLADLPQDVIPDGVEAIPERVPISYAADLHGIYQSYKSNGCDVEYLILIPSPDLDEINCTPPEVGENAAIEGVVIITHGNLDLHGISEVRGTVIMANVSKAIERGEEWLPEDFEVIERIDLAEGVVINYDQTYLDEAAKQLGDAGRRLFMKGGFDSASWD